MKTLKKVNYIRIMVIGLCMMGALKILFVGYDIDEEYALAMSYRMTQGDFMIYDMWEPHQTSGFLMALFMLPYLMITGTTTGIALFVRFCGVLCHIVVHVLFYKTLTSYLDRDYSLLVTGISFFVLPKLMFVPEFSNMQIWFLVLTSMCLLKYYGTEKLGEQRASIGYLIAAGFFTALEVFTYPSTIFAFFGVIVFIILFRKKGFLIKELAIYILPCIFSAGVVMCILLTKIPLDELGMLIGQATSDGSHSTTMLEWMERQGVSGLKITVFLLAYAFVATLLFFTLKKFKLFQESSLLWSKLWIVCALIGQVIIWLFGNQYPNYPSVEYAMVLILATVAFYRKRIERTPVFAFLFITPLLTFVGILLFSNHPIMASLPFLGTCAVGCLTLPKIKDILEEEEKRTSKVKNFTLKAVLFLWMVITVFGKCYMLRTSGGEHNTVFHNVSLFREGVAQGIIANDGVISYTRDTNRLIIEYLPEGAKLFYMGNHPDIYLLQEVEICTPSTISTPTYGENVDLYFQLYPDKKPEYVVLSNGFVNDINKDWIEGYIRENCEAEPLAENWCIKIYQCK